MVAAPGLSTMSRLDTLVQRAAIPFNPPANGSGGFFQPLVQQAQTGVQAAMPDALAQKFAFANSDEGQLIQFAEVRRIINMPVVRSMTPEELYAYNYSHVLADAFNQNWRLFNIQAEAVVAYELHGGMFGPIGVGWGKTLVSLMIANVGYARGLKKIVLFIPSHVLAQFVNVDIRWARTKVPMGYPIHILGGRNVQARRAIAASGQRGLYVFPYSLLSQPDSVDLLNAIAPELMILDEAHYVARRDAARTRRLLEIYDKFKPQVCAMSGTITSKSVRDYGHLVKMCLPQFNPLPNAASMMEEWASVLDSENSGQEWEKAGLGDVGHRTGSLEPIIVWARTNYPAERFNNDVTGFRRAYRRRLSTTPGVVSSGDAEIGTTLTLSNRPIPEHKKWPNWEPLERLIDDVELRWKTPNGEVIEHQIHTFKWMYELTTGFYNELIWPTPDVFARRRQIPEPQAVEILIRAQEHHAAEQEYAKELRQFFGREARTGLDTPMLVGGNMAQHASRDVGQKLYDCWRYMHALDFEGRPKRDKRQIRVCSYKVDACVNWAQMMNGHGGICWYYNEEMGDWIVEQMMAAGVDVLHCPAGDAYNSIIIDHANVKKIVVASMSAHGTGKNLQHFQHQIFCQWPRPARLAEQTLGRTHRNGQLADELTVYTLNTTLFDQLNFAACLVDALYIHQTTGNRQKLVYAQYDPYPKIFPPAVLIEQGFENRRLDAEAQRLLTERFGEGMANPYAPAPT